MLNKSKCLKLYVRNEEGEYINKKIIYADNAATTKMDSEALEVMKQILSEEYANPSQRYSFSRYSRELLKKARTDIAECINAEPEEIFFTSGGTESDNWAIKGTAGYVGQSKTVFCSKIEHHAVLRSCKCMEMQGFSIEYIPCNESGIIMPEQLQNMIHEPSLVSVMTINNEIGTIQPIKELAAIAHKHNALFHTDAVQAVGHIQINVKELGVDLLSASAHKFNGPRGVGFQYIKKGTPILPFINGGSQQNGLRGGTENVAAISAMAVALKNNVCRIDENNTHIEQLSKEFYSALNGKYQINGSHHRYSGICSISFKGISGESLFHLLDLKGCYVSTGAACDSVKMQVSHVLSSMNIAEEQAKSTIRISFGKDNTVEEAVLLAKNINTFISNI